MWTLDIVTFATWLEKERTVPWLDFNDLSVFIYNIILLTSQTSNITLTAVCVRFHCVVIVIIQAMLPDDATGQIKSDHHRHVSAKSHHFY